MLCVDIEFCIIGSDGLFSEISYQNAVNIVKKAILDGMTGDDACKQLINQARMYESLYDNNKIDLLLTTFL